MVIDEYLKKPMQTKIIIKQSSVGSIFTKPGINHQSVGSGADQDPCDDPLPPY